MKTIPLTANRKNAAMTKSRRLLLFLLYATTDNAKRKNANTNEAIETKASRSIPTMIIPSVSVTSRILRESNKVLDSNSHSFVVCFLSMFWLSLCYADLSFIIHENLIRIVGRNISFSLHIGHSIGDFF